jgi:hypothetical protein
MKSTKDTKVSNSKIPNFVFFVSFVVNGLFPYLP